MTWVKLIILNVLLVFLLLRRLDWSRCPDVRERFC